MNEITLYKRLLEGAIIGSFNYADKLATLYADMITNQTIFEKDYAFIFEKIISAYGDILEEHEEETLIKTLKEWDVHQITSQLKSLEEIYSSYFLDEISERRRKIEIIYHEVYERIRSIGFDLTEITNIKKAESFGDIELAGKVWKKIVENENEASWELYENTYPSVVHFLKNNNGDVTESDDIWSLVFLKFREKLNRFPQEEGYYQWRGTKKNQEEQASVITFFIMVCQRRWIDRLRKLNRTDNNLDKEIIGDAQTFEEHLMEEVEETGREYLKDKVKKAIVHLKAICQEIITGKWFGGEFGERINSKELALAIGYSEGYINNQHPKCLSDLKSILQKQ